MKFLKLLKYQMMQSTSLLIICIVFPAVIFYFSYMDTKFDKRSLDRLIEDHGSIERAMEEAPEEYESVMKSNMNDPTAMLVAGLFGGSVGMIIELFSVAMQMGVSRRNVKWAYLVNALTFTVFLSLLVWCASIVFKQYTISQATGIYEIFKPKYEDIDVGIKVLLKYILMGFPVMICGASFWLITTRFKRKVLWITITVILIAAAIFGITYAVVELEAMWIAYTIFGAVSLIMIIIYFILISTETVEHKLR